MPFFQRLFFINTIKIDVKGHFASQFLITNQTKHIIISTIWSYGHLDFGNYKKMKKGCGMSVNS
ncbi:MAG TPA: hypothetical protein DDY37_01520 [Legionella sp.]|nr:hypothetical protein [Legionella sp.]